MLIAAQWIKMHRSGHNWASLSLGFSTLAPSSFAPVCPHCLIRSLFQTLHVVDDTAFLTLESLLLGRGGGEGGLQRQSRQDRAKQPHQDAHGQHGHEWGRAQGAREVPVSFSISCLAGFCLHSWSGAMRQTLWHREHHDKDDMRN